MSATVLLHEPALGPMDLARSELPPRDRPNAQLTVMDVTKWYGETSGGIRTYLNEKARHVRSHPGLRHVLAIPGGEDALDDGDGTRTYRLRGPRIPTQQQYRFLLATRSLQRIVEHERPDVIEVGSQFFVPWVTRLATRHRRTPLVGFYHTNMERSVGAALRLDGSADMFSRSITRGYLRNVDRLFAARLAASDSLANDLRAAGIANVTRIRLGVDAATFHPDRRARRRRVRLEHGIPLDEPAVVYCGRVAPEKEIAWLVQQWKLASQFTRAWLVVIGEGPQKRELQAASREAHTRIIWLDFESNRERLADLLASMDAAVAPGPVETFGLSALEAMACGTPVISVDRGAGAELVQRSEGGATYRLRDEFDFAATIAMFLRGDLAHYGANGRRYAEREHTWERAFDELFSLYARLAGK